MIAQGFEAGGHRSTFPEADSRRDAGLGTLALVPAVLNAVRVPVVAAGGIVDGRGLAAALALGADAVQMGTRFLLATESGASSGMRARLGAASGADTRLTRALTGRPARALASPLLEAIDSPGTPPLPWPLQAVAAEDIYRAAMERDDPDWMPILAGQGLGGLVEAPAAEIVAEVAAQARAALRRASGFIPT